MTALVRDEHTQECHRATTAAAGMVAALLPTLVEALFRRIGFRRDHPQFETEAALAVECRVRRELALTARSS